ncbi:MAG: hypothetical protein EON59_05650 [Alphaproteobacteria bacterium]|nr:MAG: hypothetical protein EON59_05650 [Alphaproteobacteria bacterium]
MGDLSVIDAQIMRALERAADNGLACPTNSEICAIIGAASTTAGVNALARLQRAGHIRVERFQIARRVTIAATGKATFVAPGYDVPHWRDRDAQYCKPKPVSKRLCGIRSEPRQIEAEIPRPVFRDPCPRCGIRGDIGCEHHTPRLSMGAFA